jgi:hypothetical protein
MDIVSVLVRLGATLAWRSRITGDNGTESTPGGPRPVQIAGLGHPALTSGASPPVSGSYYTDSRAV